MASFISLLTAAQLAQLNSRAELIEKQAVSGTGTLVQADDIGEFYLDDPNAQFVANNVQAGDIVEFTAGPVLSALLPAQTTAEYYVAGQYFDPAVPAKLQVPFETRLILDGDPTLGGPVTYRVLSQTAILEELATITQTRSNLENVLTPELQVLDALFLVFLTKFDVVNNLVADTFRQIAGADRTRVTAALLDNSAVGTILTELFPEDYVELRPNRSTPAGAPTGLIDVFNFVFLGSEQEGKDEEVTAEPASAGGPLLVAYTDALTKQDAALVAQDLALVALQAEIADNDTLAEAGDLSAFYTAMSVITAAQIGSVADRRQDIADILTADDTRPNVGGLFFGSFAALQAELTLRANELLVPPFSTFLDLRYPYLDLIVNRGFGTRTDLFGNTQQILFDQERKQTLLDERVTDRDLLQLP